MLKKKKKIVQNSYPAGLFFYSDMAVSVMSCHVGTQPHLVELELLPGNLHGVRRREHPPSQEDVLHEVS